MTHYTPGSELKATTRIPQEGPLWLESTGVPIDIAGYREHGQDAHAT